MAGVAVLSLVERAEIHRDRVAVIAPEGVYTYGQLLDASSRVASRLLDGKRDLGEERVAFLTPPGFQYVATQWGIWRAGGVAVPLSPLHPKPELEYVIEDSGAATVVVHPDFVATLRPMAEERGLRRMTAAYALEAPEVSLPRVEGSRRAMILYTSGTTGRPKGVVTTHNNIQAQVMTLLEAWEWSAQDHVLNVLPLHHVHGIINVLTCALWAGAKCEILPRFDPDAVWGRIIQGGLTLFMAVPTIYSKLIAAWDAAPLERRKAMSEACSRMRLMVSGSAALPVSVLERWRSISGYILLERYGMTEIGMALSNPLHGERMPGFVGKPLPNVEVRLVDEEGNPVEPGSPGEVQVKGPGVFLEYWGNPEATRKAFRDGWFCTGDMAVVENGSYRILGRSSVDIIKTGGYKVSALEVEEVLLGYSSVQECAVVGVKDEEWGERVCAALVLKEGDQLALESLQEWARERLAVYKIPTRILLLEELPRNSMGKVNKPAVAQLFTAQQREARGRKQVISTDL